MKKLKRVQFVPALLALWLGGNAAAQQVPVKAALPSPTAPGVELDAKAGRMPAPQPVPSFTIPAWAFDRGNVQTFTQEYADAGPMVAFGGRSPVMVEYDIEFPASGQYTVRLCYAAAAARPVTLLLDGKSQGQFCRTATGSWNTSGAQWEAPASLFIPKGKRTFRLQRAGDFPHVVSLRFSSAVLPTDWVLQRPKARKLSDPPPQPLFEPWVPEVSVAALRRAIQDLAGTFGAQYPKGADFLRRLATLEAELQQSNQGELTRSNLVVLQREALVRANPLLGFSKLLLVKRHGSGPDLGLPHNWESNSSLSRHGFHDSLCLLDLDTPDLLLETLYKPTKDVFVGDVDLNFDAEKLLFSSVGTNGRWQVLELKLNGASPGAEARALTGEQPDVDSYDACYLPDGRIVFTSTACFIGVPCVYGGSHVANLYLMQPDGSRIRQLCFDQEHDWCPTVMNNGRILYSRWEYADTPHSNTRLLFHANPDGTEQMEYLGSGSYWPNAFFYARPIPGHPTKIVAVIGGHHDHPRMGELVIFDPAQGRHEASPVVQRIPGYGQKVEPLIRDGLTLNSWPKFLHPYPLNDKYFLCACKPTPDAPWGIYLVDIFDNIVPLKQLSDHALFEPVPFRATTRPPVIPDKVNLAQTEGTVVIQDIYAGEGMKGVPRGTVKSLRLFTYHFAYQGMGGLLGVVGADGPWDIKRVLGTVPVNADGSSVFHVPANTPISVQPLDAEGKAVQLMRSWMTAMPGEVVQCTGCHERQNTAPAPRASVALGQKPADIKPWYGPVRGFSYAREVQPVIDRHCVRCHDGQPQADGRRLCDLRGTEKIKDWSSVTPGNGGEHAGKFSVGYAELHRYVRRPGIESDFHVLTPMEFHADTTHLVQLLKKDHYGVRLDAESWDRLITWIDLNCPYHGTWGEEIDHPGKQRERRRDLLKLYANVEDDPEAVVTNAVRYQSSVISDQLSVISAKPLSSVIPPNEGGARSPLRPFADSPIRQAEGASTQKEARAVPTQRRMIDLGGGATLTLIQVPAGEFLMGSLIGEADERPPGRVRIEKPFWMSTLEIQNQLYARFDSGHDSRIEDKNTYQFGVHGYPVNRPEQPVVRVSWTEAMAFCQWLSHKTGERFTLPTEAQWEYACRAGTDTPFSYGGFDTDFRKHANFSDAKMTEFASDPYTVDVPLRNPTKYDDWIPKDSRFNDGALLTVAPGRYQANPWGLYDMHGNASEWTRSTYAPYPYRSADGRDAANPEGAKVVRGGSWRDVPKHGTSSFRLAYLPWQRVYNVSFRVISEGRPDVAMGR